MEYGLILTVAEAVEKPRQVKPYQFGVVAVCLSLFMQLHGLYCAT